MRMFWRSTGVRSLRSRGRCTTTPSSDASPAALDEHHVDRRRSSGRGMPHRWAAERCDAIAPGPARQHGGGDRAARASSALPTSRATPDAAARAAPRVSARYHVAARHAAPLGGLPRHQPVVLAAYCVERVEGPRPPWGSRGGRKGKARTIWARILVAGIRRRDPALIRIAPRSAGGPRWGSVAGVVVGDQGVGLGGGVGEGRGDVGAAEDRRHARRR